MARKLNVEESRHFNELLAEAELSGHTDFETLAERLREKNESRLELSPGAGLWFGDDISSLPRP